MKKDTDRVYTVNGEEGENFDVKSRGIKTAETPSLFSDAPVAAEPVAEETVSEPESAKKPRGRAATKKTSTKTAKTAKTAKAAETPAETPAVAPAHRVGIV